MKKFQYAMFILGFLSAVTKGVISAYTGTSVPWHWTLITATWILAGFFSFLHVNALEKKIKQYESK